MSHATGKVIFEDGEEFFYEYNGTCDIVCPALKKTREEVYRDWRSERNQKECTCGKPSEPVKISTEYGGGFSWSGKACRSCMAITTNLTPDDCEY